MTSLDAVSALATLLRLSRGLDSDTLDDATVVEAALMGGLDGADVDSLGLVGAEIWRSLNHALLCAYRGDVRGQRRHAQNAWARCWQLQRKIDTQ